MQGGEQQPHLREVLHDIIEGRTARRGKHDLRWNERDLPTEFIDILQERGHIPTTVEEVNVRPGQRVPAFSLGDGTEEHHLRERKPRG
jgi:hypothetical protein